MSESALGKADSDSDAGDKEVSCPTCGKGLATEHGMKIHHATVHGESLVTETRSCANCGDAYEYRPGINEKYCSRECLTDSQRKRVERECHNCGKTYETKPSHNLKYCSKECYRDAPNTSLSGDEHPQYAGRVIVECDYCGNDYEQIPSREDRSSYCSRECYNQALSKVSYFNRSGKAHPAWNGGHSEYYGRSWFGARREALERYDHKCAICSRGKEKLGKNPDIHHIIPFKDFDDHKQANKQSNLIALCQKHHNTWEGLYLKPDIRD